MIRNTICTNDAWLIVLARNVRISCKIAKLRNYRSELFIIHITKNEIILKTSVISLHSTVSRQLIPLLNEQSCYFFVKNECDYRKKTL